MGRNSGGVRYGGNGHIEKGEYLKTKNGFVGEVLNVDGDRVTIRNDFGMPQVFTRSQISKVSKQQIDNRFKLTVKGKKKFNLKVNQ